MKKYPEGLPGDQAGTWTRRRRRSRTVGIGPSMQGAQSMGTSVLTLRLCDAHGELRRLTMRNNIEIWLRIPGGWAGLMVDHRLTGEQRKDEPANRQLSAQGQCS